MNIKQLKAEYNRLLILVDEASFNGETTRATILANRAQCVQETIDLRTFSKFSHA